MKTKRFPFWISSWGARTLPRALTLTFTTIAALALLFPEGAAAAPELFCRTDELTGISVPKGRSQGVCVQHTATSRVLTLYTENGLLIAQTDTLGLGGAASPSLLQLIGAPVELLYCAAAHLNPETGAPTSQCIASDGTPGPSALTGAGSIQANATVGLLGSLQCPSSIHARGIVHSPGGEAFQLQGSLLRFSDSDDAAACETVTEELSAEYLGPVTAPLEKKFSQLGSAAPSGLHDPLLPGPNSEYVRFLEAVSNLDENQFQLLRGLTRLTPDAWEDLASHLDTTEAAQNEILERALIPLSGRPPSKNPKSHPDSDEPDEPHPPDPSGNPGDANRQPAHDDIVAALAAITDSLAAITDDQITVTGKLDQLLLPPPRAERAICVQLAGFRAGGTETEAETELDVAGKVGAVFYGNGLGLKLGFAPGLTFNSETKAELSVSWEICFPPILVRDRLAAKATAIQARDATVNTAAFIDDAEFLDKIAHLMGTLLRFA